MKLKKQSKQINIKNFLNLVFSKYRWIFLLYLLISFTIFAKLFVSSGSIVGSDWGFPDNLEQVRNYFYSMFHSWTKIGNLFGTRQISPVSILLIGPVYLLAEIGISVSFSIKMLVVLVFSLAATNINLLLRHIGVNKFAAFVAGLVFIFSPLFFNYVLIGWIYVLLSLALLPLFIYLFIRAVDENNYCLALFAAIIFSIASIQSQTVVWYPITLIVLIVSYGLPNRIFLSCLKFGAIIFFTFLLMNFYWVPALVLFPDQGVAGSDMVKSSISLGTSQRLSSYNLLRLWGSLYNYQFETSYPKVFEFISFIVPFFGFSSLFFFKKYKKHLVYLLFLFLVPVFFYLADRQIISQLPFSNLIRDIARFSIFSTFALAAMVGIFLDQLYFSKIQIKKWLLPLFLVLILINFYPVLSGKLFTQPENVSDIRLRTNVWPKEYQVLNEKLALEEDNQRAIFLPLGGLVSLTNDLRYHGEYQELPDVYAAFSSPSASVSFSDRSYGVSSEIIKEINQAVYSQDVDKFIELAKNARINYVVIRRNMDYYQWSSEEKAQFEDKIKHLADSGQAEVYFDQGTVFAVKLVSVEPLITTGNDLVEINSNHNKLLVEYLASNYLKASNFQQVSDLEKIRQIFSDARIFTFTQQNQIFSFYGNSNVSGYKFLSLDEVRDKILTTKWSLYQLNLNQKLDTGLVKDNLESIFALDSSILPSFDSEQYVIYIDEELENSTAFFSTDIAENEFSFEINGKIYTASRYKDDLFQLSNPPLSKGINRFKFFNHNVKPIIIKKNQTQLSGKTPEVVFEKINSSKYQIKLSNIRSDFYLNFAENYDRFWTVSGKSGILNKKIISNEEHFVANGFGNGFLFKFSEVEHSKYFRQNDDGSYSGEVVLIFWPDNYSGVFIFISVVSFVTAVCMIVILWIKNEKHCS